MAEAFARLYGSDVIAPASAGLAPARIIAPDAGTAVSAAPTPFAAAYWLIAR